MTRRLAARLLTLWLILSPSGLVFAHIQLAGGSSFDQAFHAAIKAGAISAITAGIGAEVGGQLSDANKITEVAKDGTRELTKAGKAYQAMSALSKMGNSYYWQQAGLNATVQEAKGPGLAITHARTANAKASSGPR